MLQKRLSAYEPDLAC